jgi:hypothetical protein
MHRGRINNEIAEVVIAVPNADNCNVARQVDVCVKLLQLATIQTRTQQRAPIVDPGSEGHVVHER